MNDVNKELVLANPPVTDRRAGDTRVKRGSNSLRASLESRLPPKCPRQQPEGKESK